METPALRRIAAVFWPIATTTATLSRCRALVASLLCVFLICVALCSPAAAQMTGGTISGVVTDSTRAVVPGAEVTILNEATGVARTVFTNEKGFYSAPNLVSGRYEVRASLAGFTTFVQKNVLVEVGQEVVAKIQLQVGAVTESTEVVARAPGVGLASSTLSNVVGGQTVRDLPINGRDWTLLAALEPGVHTIEAQNPITFGSALRANRGWGTQMTVAGNRPSQNNYRLDGISINDYSGGGPGGVVGSVLGVDAVQEFSVVTGNASADYGKTSSGVINAVTRSGQNELRGSAYEFTRNSALDARNFFDGLQKPPFKRNQFGAALGGPVRRDRTFFFFDYEGLRQDLGTTTVNTVPSRAARSGQLTSGTVTVDPRIVPYLALFPLPNGVETGDTGIFSFVSQAPTKEDLFTGRIDHKFSNANSVRATFMTDNSETTGPDAYNFVLVGQKSRRSLVSVEDTRIFGPRVINIARAGYSRSASLAPISVDSIDPRAADTLLGFLPGRPVGVMAISGIAVFPGGLGNTQTTHHYNSYQFYDDLLYTRKAHSLKFGVAIERIQSNVDAVSDATGRFTFGSLEAFLTNRPQVFNAAIPGASPRLYLRQTVFGVYAQDDFRVRPNLTLNLGMRYEMVTVPIEKYNRLSNLADITAPQPRLGSPLFDNPTLLNFSPRVGFTWDPLRTGKTAVRGGFGIYDTLPLTYLVELSVLNATPFYQAGAVSNLPQGSFPTGAFGALTATDLRYSSMQPDPKRAYVERWNLNVERQLPAGVVLHVGYVGQHGVHQPFRTANVNIVLPVQTEDGLFWPTPRGSGTRLNTSVGPLNILSWLSSSTYHGMNVHLSRATGGLTLGVSYTWSKSMDTSSSSITTTDFTNSVLGPFLFLPEAMRGPSDFDVRHNVVLNYLWNVPRSQSASGAARWLTNGWQLGGIFRAATGYPFSALIGGDSLGQGTTTPLQFPDRLRTQGCEDAVNPGDPNHYIRTECFVVPQPSNRFGNSGRNTLTGPGLTNLDLSLFKNNYIGRNDKLDIQLRAEFFNVLNHPNFSLPDRTSSQLFNQSFARLPNAGRLTTTSTASRQIQLAVKLIF